jgi:hypothetical protein
MPAARDKLEEQLKKQAPEIINAAAEHVLAAPAQVKDILVVTISGKVDEQIDSVDDQLYETLKLQIAEMASVVNKSNPNATDEEKVEILLDKAAEAYRAEAKRRIDDLYKVFLAKSEDLVVYLTHLSKDEGLNETEKLHRELVVTCLALTHKLHLESAEKNDPDAIVLPLAK